MQIEVIPIAKLVFDPNNARKHDKKNLDAIKGSLTKFGQQKPIVVDKNNVIVAGNGTVAAAKEMGWKELRCIRTELDGFMQSAFALADNRTSELAVWDDEILKETLAQLALNDFEIGEIGFTAQDFGFLDIDPITGEPVNQAPDYTKKIEAPIYEPTGPKPQLSQLFDDSKAKELIAKIDAATSIPEDEKKFLRLAAQRHVVFNYQNIAEYYAHSESPLQCHFEKSALVIIDFDKALENGFVTMADDLKDAYLENENL